jgi:hypothetical protein
MSAEVSFDRDQPDGKARSAIHFQLGKMYPTASELAPQTLNLARAVSPQHRRGAAGREPIRLIVESCYFFKSLERL